MQERKITATCIKDFVKNIQIYPDKTEFFAEKGYKQKDLCLAKKIINRETCYYTVSIRWHHFILTEEEFLTHFEIGYEEETLNACAKNSNPCQYLRAFVGRPGETNNRSAHHCHRNQDVGRAFCALQEIKYE